MAQRVGVGDSVLVDGTKALVIGVNVRVQFQDATEDTVAIEDMVVAP